MKKIPATLVKRLIWFVLIWLVSVIALGVVAFLIKMAIRN